jgi:hypothetical protein
MRTKFPLAVILALAVAFLFFTGSGFNSLVNGETSSGVDERFVERANDSSVNESLEGSRSGTDDGSIVGLVIGGADDLGGILGLASAIPSTLAALGFPTWFADPIGYLAEIIISIGLIQFVTGRIYE